MKKVFSKENNLSVVVVVVVLTFNRSVDELIPSKQ